MDITEYLLGLSVGREESDLGLLKSVSVVVDRSILGGDEGSGSVLSGRSFDGNCDGILEGVRPGEGDPLGVL